MESILDLHVSFGDGFVCGTESFKRTNIAWNAEQFVIMVHIFVFEIYTANLMVVKVSLFSAKN